MLETDIYIEKGEYTYNDSEINKGYVANAIYFQWTDKTYMEMKYNTWDGGAGIGNRLFAANLDIVDSDGILEKKIAGAEGKVIAASMLGKIKTVSQMMAIVAAIILTFGYSIKFCFILSSCTTADIISPFLLNLYTIQVLFTKLINLNILLWYNMNSYYTSS